MSEAIYRLDISERGGNLTGIFISTKERVNALVERKIEVYFGEVLGKHSEVVGTIGENEIKMVTDDPAALEAFEKYGFQTGYNPFLMTCMEESKPENNRGEDINVGDAIDIFLALEEKE